MYPVWVIYIFVALMSSITYLDTVIYFDELKEVREKKQLDHAVNSASDAAVQEMLATSQMLPSGAVHIDPEQIWKIYKYVLLRSNNMWSDSMMTTIEDSFTSVVITVNDGYYMRLLVDEETKIGRNKNYRFTQKIPYARTTQVDTNTTGSDNNIALDGVNVNLIPKGTIVSDTMDGKNIVAYKEELKSGDYPREYQVYQADGNSLPSVVGSAHDLTDINKMILQAIDYSMYYNSGAAGSNKSKATLSIPDQVSSSLLSPSVNFVGPTIFAISDTLMVNGKAYHDYYSVGGSQIVEATKYFVYERAGKNYYSKVDPVTLGIQYTHVYNTAVEAAENGYYPDPIYYK